MVKKSNIYLLIVTYLIIPQILHAQFLGFSIKSNNQIFIEQALQQTFVKLKQSYQLQDTIHNEIFGRNEKDYFSIIPFIGVRTQQGLLITLDAVHPWKQDDDFKTYDGQYTPIVFQTRLTYLSSELESVLANPVVNEANIQRLTKSPFALYVDTLNHKGLSCDTVAGSKLGWMVWVIDMKTENRPDSIQLISYKKELFIKQATDTISVDIPNENQSVLGGIFVNPVQTNVGQITFLLTGVAVNKHGIWTLHFPFLSQSTKKGTELTIIKSASKQLKFPKINKK